MDNKKTMPLSSAKKIMLRAQFRRNRAPLEFEQSNEVSKLLLPKHHKETTQAKDRHRTTIRVRGAGGLTSVTAHSPDE